jgi:RNA polymerase subunit RPABC4/transcription elongation factor Spt4
MEIAVFVIMALITLAVLGYPLWSRPAVVAATQSETRSPAAASGQMRCGHCGRELEADERFCPGCGTPAGQRCASCGRALDGDESFCPGCGVKIGNA